MLLTHNTHTNRERERKTSRKTWFTIIEPRLAYDTHTHTHTQKSEDIIAIIEPLETHEGWGRKKLARQRLSENQVLPQQQHQGVQGRCQGSPQRRFTYIIYITHMSHVAHMLQNPYNVLHIYYKIHITYTWHIMYYILHIYY